MNTNAGELADRLALRELVDAYATSVDERDAGAFSSLFLPDGMLAIYEHDANEPALSYRGAEELKTIMDLLASFINTFHVMANHTCQIESDRATGLTYCLAHHLMEGEEGLEDRVMLIRYRDTYVRTSEGWLFEVRNVLRQWDEVRPAEIAPLVE